MADDSVSCSEDLTCSICLDLFEEPLTTFCGHTFCKECIHEWTKKSFACPICKDRLILPKGVNIALQSLVHERRPSTGSTQETPKKRWSDTKTLSADALCDACINKVIQMSTLQGTEDIAALIQENKNLLCVQCKGSLGWPGDRAPEPQDPSIRVFPIPVPIPMQPASYHPGVSMALAESDRDLLNTALMESGEFFRGERERNARQERGLLPFMDTDDEEDEDKNEFGPEQHPSEIHDALPSLVRCGPNTMNDGAGLAKTSFSPVFWKGGSTADPVASVFLYATQKKTSARKRTTPTLAPSACTRRRKSWCGATKCKPCKAHDLYVADPSHSPSPRQACMKRPASEKKTRRKKKEKGLQ